MPKGEAVASMPHRFQPGNNRNPAGRPKGSRNKFGEVFVGAFLDDFNKYGVRVIEQVREESPHIYLRIAASIVPAEVNLNLTNQLQELTDAELDLLERFAEQQQALQIEHQPEDEEIAK